jgi:uncharacterized protein
MPDLPTRPDLVQLRRQAKELLAAARAGNAQALARLDAVAGQPTLAAAQLALAREHGFSSWTHLKAAVEARLAALLSESAMRRFNEPRPEVRARLETAADARALLAAGAPVNGRPGERETPLITAASYGDAEVAHVLIEAGADLEAKSAANAGGIPEETALAHAAVFGMTDILDLLVAAGARVHSLEEAAAAGDISGWLKPDSPLQAKIRALVFAADHQRLPVIDRLIEADTPVDAFDEVWNRQALRTAAQNGRPASVRRLLDHGADPNLHDDDDLIALDWCSPARRYLDGPGHAEVEAILQPPRWTIDAFQSRQRPCSPATGSPRRRWSSRPRGAPSACAHTWTTAAPWLSPATTDRIRRGRRACSSCSPGPMLERPSSSSASKSSGGPTWPPRSSRPGTRPACTATGTET